MLASRRRSAAFEPIAAPVLQGERYAGQPIYFSDVIVRRDSPFRSFAGLRGASWAYNERSSHSGYGITRFTLVTMGETAGFFSRVIEAGSHQNAIRMVAAGEVDASAIDSQVLAIELRDHPELAEGLRVVGSLGPSTIQPVVVSVRLPVADAAAVRAALLSMGDDPSARPWLDRGLIERFVRVDGDDYRDIRAMVRAAEEAHFLVLR